MASELALALHGPLDDVLDLIDRNDDPGILRAAVINIGRRVEVMERGRVHAAAAGVPQESGGERHG